MSLDVSPDLLASAERGPVDEAAFVDCIRTSLPYAWETISLLVAEKSGFKLTPDGNGHATAQGEAVGQLKELTAEMSRQAMANFKDAAAVAVKPGGVVTSTSVAPTPPPPRSSRPQSRSGRARW